MLKHIPFYASLLGRDLAEGISKQGHVLVYGAIEAHAMGERGCIASNKTIAEETGLSTGRTANLISELSKAGWVHVELNDKNTRDAIVPLMTIHADVKGGSRVSEGGVHAHVNINTVKKHLDKNIQKNSEDIKKLYRGWLIEMVIGSMNWLGLDDSDSRTRAIEIAAKKVRLTEKRRQKINSRIESLGYSRCAIAIKHLGQSDWHKGDNDNKWVASIEWLFNSDEKTEEWANRK